MMSVICVLNDWKHSLIKHGQRQPIRVISPHLVTVHCSDAKTCILRFVLIVFLHLASTKICVLPDYSLNMVISFPYKICLPKQVISGPSTHLVFRLHKHQSDGT